MFKILQSIFLIAALFMPLFATAAEDEPMAAAIVADAISIATVVDIDKDSRILKLKDEDGQEESFIASPEVRNFDQIKRGDLVIAQFLSTFAIAIGPNNGGLEERADELDIKRAKLGEKPGVSITQTDIFEGSILAVDQKSRKVTVQGAEQTLDFVVSQYVDLSQIKVGEEIEVLYVTSFAISVEPAPKVSGTVEIESTSVALGFGVEWGHGQFTMNDGTSYTFDIKGISVIDLGISKVNAVGKIYKLVESKDLEGVFIAGNAGVALGNKGKSTVAMKNSKGVIMKLTSKQEGVKLTLAPEGLKISNIKPAE